MVFVWLVFCLLFSYVCSLYILAHIYIFFIYISSLSVIWFGNILSHLISCLYILLMVSFVVHKLFNLICFCFFYFDKRLKFSARPLSRMLPLIFSSRSLMVSEFHDTFKSLFHLSWFLCRYKIEIQFHHFVLWLIFPTHLLKRLCFPIIYSWLLCHKSICRIHMGLLLVPLIYVYILCQYHSVVITVIL